MNASHRPGDIAIAPAGRRYLYRTTIRLGALAAKPKTAINGRLLVPNGYAGRHPRAVATGDDHRFTDSATPFGHFD
jgi:hypothetical protein